MSEVTTPTRTETVTANIDAVIEKYGPEATERINTQCLLDINLSLAALVDAQETSGSGS